MVLHTHNVYLSQSNIFVLQMGLKTLYTQQKQNQDKTQSRKVQQKRRQTILPTGNHWKSQVYKQLQATEIAPPHNVHDRNKN